MRSPLLSISQHRSIVNASNRTRKSPHTFQRSQRLKRPPRLTPQLSLQSPQVAPMTQLPPMLIHHTKVHEQMRLQHVQFEIRTLDV